MSTVVLLVAIGPLVLVAHDGGCGGGPPPTTEELDEETAFIARTFCGQIPIVTARVRGAVVTGFDVWVGAAGD